MGDPLPALLAGNELSAEDKRTFPLEDASTNCAGRGLIAGLFGMPPFRVLLVHFSALVLTSLLCRYSFGHVLCVLQHYP